MEAAVLQQHLIVTFVSYEFLLHSVHIFCVGECHSYIHQ